VLDKSSELHNLPDDWVRELFKHSKDSVRLLVCIEKNWMGFGFFVGDIKWGRF